MFTGYLPIDGPESVHGAGVPWCAACRNALAVQLHLNLYQVRGGRKQLANGSGRHARGHTLHVDAQAAVTHVIQGEGVGRGS